MATMTGLIAGPEANTTDEGFEPELPDFEPTEEDARWWAEQVGHLAAQRANVGALSLPEHDAALADARRKTTLRDLRAHRDNLLRALLSYRVGCIDFNVGGWAGDRLAEIGAVDADLIEADPAHKPFVGWGIYRARLAKYGKGENFQPNTRWR